MSPCRSALASLAGAPTGSRRGFRDRSRWRRRVLVHARQVRASPSEVCAESLKAAADNAFPQSGQVFLATMSHAVARLTQKNLCGVLRGNKLDVVRDVGR